MSEETTEQQQEQDPRKKIVDASVMVAQALRESADPDEALQILSIATGMILCASSPKRENINEVMDTFCKQVNLWADFEEEGKTASWLMAH